MKTRKEVLAQVLLCNPDLMDTGAHMRVSDALEAMKLYNEEKLKTQPKGSAKEVFSKFWSDIEKDNLTRKTLASLAFDCGHALRHEVEDNKVHTKEDMLAAFLLGREYIDVYGFAEDECDFVNSYEKFKTAIENDGVFNDCKY